MPIISIARELKNIKPEIELHYIGPKSDFELLRLENFKIHSILAGKIRRYFAWQNFIDLLFKIPFDFLQSFFLLLLIRPKLVFSKGGTGSMPVTYCAKLFRIPVFIHESDMVPGLSNKIASKWAKKIFISFENTEYFNQKAILVGNPIRKELLKGDEKSAKEIFEINSKKSVVLFLGGSQGARSINEFVVANLNDILEKYEVIHVSGPKNYKGVQLESSVVVNKDLKVYYHLRQSLNEIELKHAYKVADVIISRAGSGSIFEISALGKPSILIPLPSSASDHQSKNAYQYSKTGAALVIEQENLSPHFFIGQINHVISDRENMKNSALKFAKPEAAENIAKEIIEYLK